MAVSGTGRTLLSLVTRRRVDVCVNCLVIRQQNFHTHNVLFKKHKKKRPIIFDKKTQLEVSCKVFRGMTFEELAKATNKSIDDVYGVYAKLSISKKCSRKNFPKSALSNWKLLDTMVRILGYNPEFVTAEAVEQGSKDICAQPSADAKDLVQRPPVITIMGHVDHGKTSILDYLRKSKIVDQEFGGITQHIGAFQVKVPTNEIITFLDTPGHAAFSAMRQRGAGVTDIVVLVVAADDGVMDQTVESIRYAKVAGVPIIVAINKIDKPGVEPELVKRMLLNYEVAVEGYGGDIQAVLVSAIEGTNMSDLLEAILTQAEIMELKSDPGGKVEGCIIESKVDPGKGKVATVLVQRGTLRKGTVVIAGTSWTKVRAMFDEYGKPVQEAPPSMPVEITGWRDLPSAGDQLLEAPSERAVKEAIEYRQSQIAEVKELEDIEVIEQKRQTHLSEYNKKRSTRLALGLFRRMWEKGAKDIINTDPALPIVLKGDVDGSLEAILNILATYKSTKCRLDLVNFGVGNVSISDVEKAAVFGGMVYAFNVTISDDVQKLAELSGVPIRLHNVIYKLFDELVKDLKAQMPPIESEEVVGEAEVQQLFTVRDAKKNVQVAGCKCVDGNLNKDLLYNIYRDEELVHTGSLSSLRHLKNEVKVITTGMECGLLLEDQEFYFEKGDKVVCFKKITLPPEIDWNPGF